MEAQFFREVQKVTIKNFLLAFKLSCNINERNKEEAV